MPIQFFIPWGRLRPFCFTLACQWSSGYLYGQGTSNRSGQSLSTILSMSRTRLILPETFLFIYVVVYRIIRNALCVSFTSLDTRSFQKKTASRCGHQMTSQVSSLPTTPFIWAIHSLIFRYSLEWPWVEMQIMMQKKQASWCQRKSGRPITATHHRYEQSSSSNYRFL